MATIDIRESKHLSGKYSGFVSLKYNAKVINSIRSLPFRYYDAETRTWEIPLNKVDDVCYWVNQVEDCDIIGYTDALSTINDKNDCSIPETFQFKTKPYEHQLVGVEYGLKYDNWFLGDEMGLGKSKQVIDIAICRKIKYRYKHCLIVCGVNTLKWNWMLEVETHSCEKAHILGQKERKGKIVIGSSGDKFKDLVTLEKDETCLPYFIITNIESFRDEVFAKQIQRLCKLNIINMCAIDEAHKCKNPQSQQTKGFLKCQPSCKIAMTGTPIMNNPLDVYVILKWLGYEQHAFYAFKKHYCVFGGFGGWEIVGYQNMKQLQNQMNEIMLRRLKSDVFDLPEKTYVEDYVEMTPKQCVIYNEVECDIKAHIDEVQFENNPLSTLIRLRQATGYTGILSSNIQESAKLDRLDELVEEAISNEQQVIVFSNWTQMTDIIYSRLSKKYPSSLITGDTKDNVRQFNVESFQNGDTKVIIGTIGAMGTGLTLTAGTIVIFVDEPWNRALFEQAVDRAHRIGTTKPITIYSIMCKDTIDERIHDIIYKKGLISDLVIDGKIVGDKTAVMNYLLS